MKKYIILILSMVMILLCSCSERDNISDAVRIWFYEQEGYTIYGDYMNLITEELRKNAQAKDIELEIKKFSSKEMSYENYVLKRNIAIENNDVDILFDNSYNLHSIKEYAGDYSKLSTYENIFDKYRGRYCIPVSSNITTYLMNRDVLEYYGIEADKVIKIEEYYEIKQKLKDMGARFKFNEYELYEMILYAVKENGLRVVEEDKGIAVDENVVKNIIEQLYEEVMENYDISDEFEATDSNRTIFDKVSGMDFYRQQGNYPSTNINAFVNGSRFFPIDNYSVVLNHNDFKNMNVPCLFINKNTANEDVYKLASILFNNDFQKKVFDGKHGGVVIDTDEIRKYMGFDEDWKYIKQAAILSDWDIMLNDIRDKSYEIVRFGDFEELFTDFTMAESLGNFIKEELLIMLRKEQDSDGGFHERFNRYLTNLNMRYN